ncbi:MAG TPA: glucan biosynthesis protein [Caulobacteraceae bacterium]|nr:glucan biosynthesis protein [Caulobacteraceae bacterium]
MSSNTTRRALTAGIGAITLRPSLAVGAAPSKLEFGAARSFSFDALKHRARQMAAAAYKAPAAGEGALLQAIDYDANGQILYRPELALWADVPGAQAVRFFPLSRRFRERVQIHVVEAGQARELIYRPDLFRLPDDSPLRRLKTGGFAGFRVMNGRSGSDWLAFLGASYFRASGPFDQYGASARGLSIDTGQPTPEEFPRFTAFWLERLPDAGVRAYALLDSPSVAGAYRIDNRQTPAGPVQEIQAELHFRRGVANLGLMPLTSMYWRGPTDGAEGPQAQVHDSDGLELWTGRGERIWRPLNDPPRPTLNSFLDQAPRGFGLIQRDRDAGDYQAAPLFYAKRPSVWVEPLTPLGKGAVRLLELPTARDSDDNIGAFWTPARAPEAGTSLALSYRLRWCDDAPPIAPLGRILATHVSPNGPAGRFNIAIDVQGPALEGLSDANAPEAKIDCSPGVVDRIVTTRGAGEGAWRIAFDLTAPLGHTVDLRAYLRRADQTLSETWLYQLQA